ncbi:MAG TPA: type II toxin-antitoxin system VapC family toxin [Acidimicrobiales bacterium]|nr:type II toxin-antitoxin system VapC family toxin [Acidimicrobiales bacterium]
MSASDDEHVEGEFALADTSLFIAVEQDRPFSSQLPERVAVSVVTVGELRLGVLAAKDGMTRARRLETLSAAAALDPLPIDEGVAHAWATLRLVLRDAGKRMSINDSWIAATAIANDLAVASQDSDYDDIPGLRVIRV